MRRFHREWLLVCMAAGVLGFWSAYAAKTRRVDVGQLRIGGQVSGWNEEKKAFVKFNGEKLFELIDGGAPQYIDKGLQVGIFQRLANAKGATIELYAEDFGSPSNAQAMYAEKIQNLSGVQPLAGFDSTRISYSTVIGGYQVYACMDRFYFELTLMGMADAALGEIGKVLHWLQGQMTEG